MVQKDSAYPGIRAMAKDFNCCNKSINKTIRFNILFQGQWYVRYTPKNCY